MFEEQELLFNSSIIHVVDLRMIKKLFTYQMENIG